MRYLPQFLTKWLNKRNRKEKASWSRSTPWRQGSVVPSGHAIKLRLIEKRESHVRIALVVSHDCDLANGDEYEPNVEIAIGSLISACSPDKTHAKNVRILHLEMNGPTGRTAVELMALSKVTVPKERIASFGPDDSYSIDRAELDTLRSWLAARYKRASIPDGLQKLIKEILEEVAKKKERPKAIRGIWIDFDPDLDSLPPGEKYELWVAVVYSTSEEGSQSAAEEAAKLLIEKFKRKYWKNGNWSGVELRECVARSDTEFTLYDTMKYRLFRLEYLSLRVGASSETGRE